MTGDSFNNFLSQTICDQFSEGRLRSDARGAGILHNSLSSSDMIKKTPGL